jgi:hypothetical protein
VSEIVVAGNPVLDWEPAPPNVGNTVMWFLLAKGVVFQINCWYAGAKHLRCPVWATIAAKHVYDQLK